ncbi:hypothetical protein Glove_481g35 [Diversispora epigaea]|uniref:Uncharacterized protein n=1 Tax=Diversispora epigaea TaxID=1348612 RepID=A0A397GJX4_9GLOM|nr:hypothetical protein Glove_481g35 [Diversispora epigaea]
MTGFYKQQFDKYEHQKINELFWCQDLYTRFFSKQEKERERFGDKRDGILYMNIQAMMTSLWYQCAHQSEKTSGVNFLQIRNIVEIVKKFKQRKITRLPKPGLPLPTGIISTPKLPSRLNETFSTLINATQLFIL